MSQHSDSLVFPVSPGASFLLPLAFVFPGIVVVTLAVVLNWGR